MILIVCNLILVSNSYHYFTFFMGFHIHVCCIAHIAPHRVHQLLLSFIHLLKYDVCIAIYKFWLWYQAVFQDSAFLFISAVLTLETLQLEVPQKSHSIGAVAFYGLRWVLCFGLMETMTHFFYYNAFANRWVPSYFRSSTFFVKVLLLFGCFYHFLCLLVAYGSNCHPWRSSLLDMGYVAIGTFCGQNELVFIGFLSCNNMGLIIGLLDLFQWIDNFPSLFEECLLPCELWDEHLQLWFNSIFCYSMTGHKLYLAEVPTYLALFPVLVLGKLLCISTFSY